MSQRSSQVPEKNLNILFSKQLSRQIPMKTSQSLLVKGGFFPESAIHFLDLQISKKKYSKKLSWTWNLKFPPKTVLCYGQEF